ncbi:flavin reductase family protein [Streptomyces sp. NPDC102340]|uniref:flavin reductase family protein n=1 Tax=unclassified Streptomyces TaxID=2593676 RepID=UPI0037F9751E
MTDRLAETVSMTDSFKEVMARFPTGVAIATVCDEHGLRHGMTVSSFCSVSLDPPLVLLCVAKSARSFPAFARAAEFAVSVLREHHTDLAKRFATSDAEKFGRGGLQRTSRGGVVVGDALAVVECLVDQLHDAGDHLIVVGRVVDARATAEPGAPAVYFNRRFAALSPAS